jgi:hypothetical protein
MTTNYHPGPPSSSGDRETNRWIHRELQRISTSFSPRYHQAYFGASETGQADIGPAVNWQPILPTAPLWEVPEGSWQSPLWVVPMSGFYSLSVSLQLDPFGLGNKLYYAGVRLTVTPPGGPPAAPMTVERYQSGDDNFPLYVNVETAMPIEKGGTVLAERTLVHENQTGTVTAQIGLNYWRK